MNRPLVIQTEHLDEAPAAWLAERCELVRRAPADPGFSELLARADGLLIRTYTRVDATMLAAAPKLKVVGRAGVGLDNVDLPACVVRGVRVVYTPDANTRAVVEYATALMLDMLRPRVFLETALAQQRWNEMRRELRAPRQLCELTLGIYGFGRIGSAMARIGAALDMRVIYHDLLEFPPERRSGATPVSRAELLAESDVLSVHVDGRPSNARLIDGEALARLKPDATLINTSRGFVIDVPALAAFAEGNPRSRIVLDVHEPEPYGAEYPLLRLPNVHLAPHLASATVTAQENMSWVVRDIWRVLNGEAPHFPAPRFDPPG